MPSNRQQALSAPPVPTLPSAPDEYSAQNTRTSSGLIRTFMIRLTSGLQSLFGPGGGQYIDNPNGLFFSTATQNIAVIDTSYPVDFNVTDLNNTVTVVDSNKITVLVAGIYNFQYAANLESTNASSKNVWFWTKLNGVDTSYARITTLSGAGTYGTVNWNFSISMQANDYLQVMWAADDTNVQLVTNAASTPYPVVPASILSVIYVSSLPP